MNWAEEYRAAHRAGQDLVRRTRCSMTYEVSPGVFSTDCVGKRWNYESAPGTWEAIDTAIRNLGTHYGGLGTLARLYLDGRNEVEGGTYAQRTLRVGRFRPSTQNFSGVITLPSTGRTIQGDKIICSGVYGGANWSQSITLTEDGLREELRFETKPTLPGGTQLTDWIVFETQVWGVTFPDGWLDSEYEQDGVRFHLPTAQDANGKRANCRRYARNVSGAQYIYTGVQVSWFNAATYPVVIDPDYAADAADGYLMGQDGDDTEDTGASGTYANARNTSDSAITNINTAYVGQTYSNSFFAQYNNYRGAFKFDTSGIPDGDTISQGNAKLTPIFDGSTADVDIYLVKYDWSASDPITAGNRETVYDGILAAANDALWRNTSGIVVNTQYTSGNLDVTRISKTGATYYGLISAEDTNNSAPVGAEYVGIATQDHATAGYRPVLTVVHSAGGTAVQDVIGFGIVPFAR